MIEPTTIGPRLLSPRDAAAYLGLGSRWAIYRLVAAGHLAAVKIAGKLRIDRADLDRLIEVLKSGGAATNAAAQRRTAIGVPAALAPLRACERIGASGTAGTGAIGGGWS